MNPAFWRGKSVFLTGHTGFKGSWLALWLQSLGAEPTGFALPAPTEPSLFDQAGVAAGMNSLVGDVRDLPALQAALRASRAEIVFHLAAQPLVRQAYGNPVDTYATNVMGTVNMLEAVRQSPGVRAVVNVTTDKCYDNREWVWGYRETDALGGYDPYSSSKACAELASAAYRSSYFNPGHYAEHGLALATARAGNVIGGGDWARDRLLPDLLSAFAAGRCARIRQPAAIRPWQHVLEPLRGYLDLAERLYGRGPEYAEGWNFGPRPEDARPVAWVAEEAARLWGGGASWRSEPGAYPHEAGWLALDIAKARRRLDWQPLLELREALRLTVDWCQEHLAGADVRRLTLGQIERYQALAIS